MKVVPPNSADVFVKLEWQNPTGSIAGYFPLGEEIWTQTGGNVDAFVHSVGTAASSRGVATVLKRHRPDVKIAVVEPGESAVLLGGQQRRTTSRGSASAIRRRYPIARSWMRSSRCLARTQKRWRVASRVKRGCSAGRRREPTSSPRFASPSSLVRVPLW